MYMCLLCKTESFIFMNIIMFSMGPLNQCFCVTHGWEVIKLFSCSTQLGMKFTLLINVKMPTIVGILTFICKTNERL